MAEAGADLISRQLFQLVECVGIAQAEMVEPASSCRSARQNPLAGARLTVHFQDIISTPNRFATGVACCCSRTTPKGGGHHEPARC